MSDLLPTPPGAILIGGVLIILVGSYLSAKARAAHDGRRMHWYAGLASIGGLVVALAAIYIGASGLPHTSVS